MSRSSYEFNNRTKDNARNKWHGENPGRKDEDLEVDHIVAIWWMRKNGIPPVVGKSAQNAQALPVKEHKQKHRDESDEEYSRLAGGLIGFIRSLL